MRLQTLDSNPVANPHGGPRRAKRAEETLETGQRFCASTTRSVAGRLLVIGALLMPATLSAQLPGWIKHPTAGIPRTADGKPDLAAPAPRAADGKPDLSGLWRPGAGLIGDISRGMKEADAKAGGVPFQPWSEQLYKSRRASESKDDPTASCIVGGVPRSDLVPYPFKILTVPGMTVILYEAVHSYRQIFTDGRALPADPNPQWFGYSVGKWDGDTFVVESAGFNDNVWLDNFGHPATGALKVTERFHRKNVGQMDVEITINDPKAYTRPWTVVLPLTLQADTELIEYMCNENNKYHELVK
jgi:hypothetical protein